MFVLTIQSVIENTSRKPLSLICGGVRSCTDESDEDSTYT